MLSFDRESLPEILDQLERALGELAPGESLRFRAPNPVLTAGHYDGENIFRGGRELRVRRLAAWVELAEGLRAELQVLRADAGDFVNLGLRPLDPAASWHRGARPSGDVEKYGSGSGFERIDKFEEPSHLLAFRQAIEFLEVPTGGRGLVVGCNQGDELLAVARCTKDETLGLLGIDHSASAISEARRRFAGKPFDFLEADLASLESLSLGRFDLLVAINTLHSPGFDGRELFRRLMAGHCEGRGRVLLGFPNSRYLEQAPLFGALRRGHERPDLSLLLKDLSFHKRYLQQHGFRVGVFGKKTILIAGRRDVERG